MAVIDLGITPPLKILVYENLKARIVNGELRPGTHLLEQNLSRDMNVSRAPIREAINMLERDGLATIIPRKGAIVTVFTKTDVLHIWEMRQLLEPHAAVRAMANITEEELDHLEQMLLKVQADPTNMDLYAQADLETHDLFYRRVENKYMKSTLYNLKMRSLCIRWPAERHDIENQAVVQPVVSKATEEHLAILRALRARDEQAVFDAVETHLRQSCERNLCEEDEKKA